MATDYDEHLGITTYRDDERLPTTLYVHRHRSGTLSLSIQSSGGGLNASVELSRDQALWLASALAEATEEQPTVTVTEVTQ